MIATDRIPREPVIVVHERDRYGRAACCGAFYDGDDSTTWRTTKRVPCQACFGTVTGSMRDEVVKLRAAVKAADALRLHATINHYCETCERLGAAFVEAAHHGPPPEEGHA